LNYDNASLRAYTLDTSLYWVDSFGIDGYRADASVLIPDEFWKAWREALKSKHPDLLLLSESDPFNLYEAGFEVAYDWKTMSKFLLALKSPTLGSDLLDYLASEQGPDSIPVWRLRYLENHDQERIAIAARTPEQRKLAAAFLLTLPGLPLIYAGQEVGAVNRPTIDWTTVDWSAGDDSLRESYAGLIRLRKSSPALMQGNFTPLKGMPNGVFAYQRRAGSARVVVALNFKEAPVDVTIQETTGGKDLLSDERIRKGSLTLAGYGFKVIQAP
jgi:cyclomaltodextrinase / maltogenic alpha-amylase / neopullulanase